MNSKILSLYLFILISFYSISFSSAQLIGVLENKDSRIAAFLKTINYYSQNNLSKDSANYNFADFSMPDEQVSSIKVDLINFNTASLDNKIFGGLVNSFSGSKNSFVVNLSFNLVYHQQKTKVKVSVTSDFAQLITKYVQIPLERTYAWEEIITYMETFFVVNDSTYNDDFKKLDPKFQKDFATYLSTKFNVAFADNFKYGFSQFAYQPKSEPLVLANKSRTVVDINMNKVEQPHVFISTEADKPIQHFFISHIISGQVRKFFPLSPFGFNNLIYKQSTDSKEYTFQTIFDKVFVQDLIDHFVATDDGTLTLKEVSNTANLKTCSPDLYNQYKDAPLDVRCTGAPAILDDKSKTIDGSIELTCDVSVKQGFINYTVYRLNGLVLNFNIIAETKQSTGKQLLNFKLNSFDFAGVNNIEGIYASIDSICLNTEVKAAVKRSFDLIQNKYILAEGINFFGLINSPQLELFSHGLLVYPQAPTYKNVDEINKSGDHFNQKPVEDM